MRIVSGTPVNVTVTVPEKKQNWVGGIGFCLVLLSIPFLIFFPPVGIFFGLAGFVFCVAGLFFKPRHSAGCGLLIFLLPLLLFLILGSTAFVRGFTDGFLDGLSRAIDSKTHTQP